MSLNASFPGNDPKDLFASEELMRTNALALRSYTRQILEDRNLPLSQIADEWFIELNQGQLRKDGVTPSEQHEQSHDLNLDALLRAEGNKVHWDQEKYGTLDALYTAIKLHDVLEDHGFEREQLFRTLGERIQQNFKVSAFKVGNRTKLYHDLTSAIEVVSILSRNQPLENGTMPDRTDQTNKILNHPFAVIIKLIDWTNKLATMPTVEPFEKDNQKRMLRNLKETSEIFDSQRGALAQRAMELYPEFRSMIKILHANMAVTYNIVDGYANHCSPDYDGTPSKEPPYNFKEQIALIRDMTNCLPKGVAMPWVAKTRVEQAGIDRSNKPQLKQRRHYVRDFHDHVVAPAVESLFKPVNGWHITKIFSGAVAACKSLIRNPAAPEISDI